MSAALIIMTMLAGGGPLNDIVYTCVGTVPLLAQFQDSAVQLIIGKRTIVLPQARSGSGARFFDGKVLFWIKGQEAVFDSGDGVARSCRVTDPLTGRG